MRTIGVQALYHCATGVVPLWYRLCTIVLQAWCCGIGVPLTCHVQDPPAPLYIVKPCTILLVFPAGYVLLVEIVCDPCFILWESSVVINQIVGEEFKLKASLYFWGIFLLFFGLFRQL